MLRRREAAASANTEKFNGALIPNERVIENAKRLNSPALTSETKRGQIPRIRPMPSKISAAVAATVSASVQLEGRKLLTMAV
jgi:hypothetical protein